MNELLQASKILSENIYCCVATSSKNGLPWNTPVFYSYDHDLNLYWASATDSVHSHFIKENPSAFIVVYNSTAPPRSATALYLQGYVEILENEKLDQVVHQHFKRVNEDSLFTGDYYRGSSPERIYKFMSQNVWILGKPVTKQEHPIDSRKELPLNELKKHLNLMT